MTNYLLAAARGRMVDGPEAELAAAAGVTGIPIELWDVPETRQTEDGREIRAITPAPGTVGVNLDPIQPAIFANSIAPRLGIAMPRVGTGTYASATITGSQSAEAKDKSAAIAATAGAMTVTTATPKRVSARLELTLEDIAAVGQANFESALRENLSLALSDELDDQAINGDGNAPNLKGLFNVLTDPAAPAAGVAAFDTFVATFAGGVDGLWAGTLKDIAIVAGPETYRLAAQSFRDVGTNNGHRGDISFADYAMAHFGGWWTNKRMPDKANHIQQGILYRKGRSGMGASAGTRTAACPHWGEVSIDDIYSGIREAGSRHPVALRPLQRRSGRSGPGVPETRGRRHGHSRGAGHERPAGRWLSRAPWLAATGQGWAGAIADTIGNAGAGTATLRNPAGSRAGHLKTSRRFRYSPRLSNVRAGVRGRERFKS